MTKYRIWASAYASTGLGEFEAEDKDQAIEMAYDKLSEKSLGLCHHCARDVDIGDFDISDTDIEEVTEST